MTPARALKLIALGLAGVLLLAAQARYDLTSAGEGARFMEPVLSTRSWEVLRTDGQVPPRGAIVWFTDPRGGEELLVSRVVGLPGESVALEGGGLVLDGHRVPEDLAHGQLAREGRPAIRVPRGFVYCLNDARAPQKSGATDSRGLGPVPVVQIVGWLTGDAVGAGLPAGGGRP